MRRCHCGRSGAWQHPIDREWLCDRHAPQQKSDRDRCGVCHRAGAWRHTTDGWFCMEHMSRR